MTTLYLVCQCSKKKCKRFIEGFKHIIPTDCPYLISKANWKQISRKDYNEA